MSTATRLAARFQALADPTRLLLLQFIAAGEPTATDCILQLEQSQPRVARHLRILVEAGLLVARREGRFSRYALASSGGGEVIAAAALALLATGAPGLPAPRVPVGSVAAPPALRGASVGLRARDPETPAPPAEAEPESSLHRPMEDFLL